MGYRRRRVSTAVAMVSDREEELKSKIAKLRGVASKGDTYERYNRTVMPMLSILRLPYGTEHSDLFLRWYAVLVPSEHQVRTNSTIDTVRGRVLLHAVNLSLFSAAAVHRRQLSAVDHYSRGMVTAAASIFALSILRTHPTLLRLNSCCCIPKVVWHFPQKAYGRPLYRSLIHSLVPPYMLQSFNGVIKIWTQSVLSLSAVSLGVMFCCCFYNKRVVGKGSDLTDKMESSKGEFESDVEKAEQVR